jgi:DNA repair exonuclease SbcCD ATPase subunit
MMSEDYIYDRVLTMDERIAAAQAKMAQIDQRVTAALAKLEAKIDQRHKQDEEIYRTLGKLEAAVDVLTLQVNTQTQKIHKLSEHQNHADAWLHKLLNPDDNPSTVGTASAGQFSGDHEDGV